MTEQIVREIASIAWKGAANAFRMYPENKHTFTDYWDGAKNQFDQYIQKPTPSAIQPAGIEQIVDQICNPEGKRFGLYNRENTIKCLQKYAEQLRQPAGIKGLSGKEIGTYKFDPENEDFVIVPNAAGKDVEEMAKKCANEWVFEINANKWSNNDDTAGDNFGSYKAGYKAGHAAAQNPPVDKLAAPVKEVLEESGGLWRPCSGCHETVDGQETGYYPFNETFQCIQGSGCHECGGIGVVWDEIREYPAPVPPPVGVDIQEQAENEASLRPVDGDEISPEEILDMHVPQQKGESSFREFLPEVYRKVIAAMKEYGSRCAIAASHESPSLPSDLVETIKKAYWLLSGEPSEENVSEVSGILSTIIASQPSSSTADGGVFIDNYTATKELKYSIACTITAQMAAIGIDITDDQQQYFQDNVAEGIVDEVLDALLEKLSTNKKQGQ